MKKVIVTVIMFCQVFIFVPEVFAYGWGYKQTEQNTLPDIGIYEKLIQGRAAYYADLKATNEIYLTFDNGYEQGYTEKILSILRKHDVPATFFVTGHYVKSEPDLINRMVNEGHTIGNHSYHHKDFTKLTKEEMKKELAMLEEVVKNVSKQKKTLYVRPPEGTFNEQTLQWAEELGYIHIFWSVAFKDWESDVKRGWNYAYDNVMQQVHPGAIILLHTVSADNAAALEKIIVDLKKQGYTFKSLDHLMAKQMLLEEQLHF